MDKGMQKEELFDLFFMKDEKVTEDTRRGRNIVWLVFIN
jgi:hypothetical protein